MHRYQQALHATGTEAGERDCQPRWDLIADFVPESGLVLDIGSNLGYYGLRAIERSTDIGVVSVEADPEIVEMQGELLREHDTTRICLVQGELNARVAAEWVDTCDWFDLTLMLSVVHWLDDPAAVVRDVSKMSASMIVEVPDPRDRGACGQKHLAAWSDPAAWFEQVTQRRVTTIGRMSRHTSAVPSHLLLIDGPVDRVATRPYWGATYERADASPYVLSFNGSRTTLTLRGATIDYRPGINLVSLMKLGRLVHPRPDYWLASASAAIESEPGHGDPFPHNMLWSGRGVTLIDGDDLRSEAPREAGLRSVGQNVQAWVQNRTTSEFGYVRERIGLRRRSRSLAGRVLRSLFGDRAVDRLKTRIGLGAS